MEPPWPSAEKPLFAQPVAADEQMHTNLARRLLSYLPRRVITLTKDDDDHDHRAGWAANRSISEPSRRRIIYAIPSPT